METIIAFLIALVILVVIHELGHFLTAKLFSVRVEEFGIGYPPRAKKLFTWQGTLFTLNWLPFGGFVKIFGEDSDEAHARTDAEKARSFEYQKFWKRAVIILAGVVSNALLAMVLYSASFAVGFLGSPSDFPGSVALSPEHVLVTDVVGGSPAQAAGLESGDTVTGLKSGSDTATPSTALQLTDFIHSHGTAPLAVTVLRGSQSVTLVATPQAGLSNGMPGIGIDIAEAARIRLPLWPSIKMGVSYACMEFKEIVVTLGILVAGLFGFGQNIVSQISGPVGIAKIAGTALGLGFGSFLSFMALISVNLAVVNLLPFPALDGGRLVLECFSSNGRSKISARAVNWINQAGFAILIILMIYVTYHDIIRLIA